MKGARGWIIAAAFAVAIAAVAYAFQPAQDSPEHSSNSDAANGASAALLYAQAMGHPTDQITGSFDQPNPFSIMFVFTPTSPYTSAEADATLAWVRRGGVLIYASERGDPELNKALGVTRLGGFVWGGQYAATPIVSGVTKVAGAGDLVPLDPAPTQVTFLRTQQGFSAGYIQRIGIGSAIVLADPLVLCNGYLEKSDNGRLLADLLGTVDTGSRVAFDEYHHGLTASDLAPQAWVTTPWGAALLWLLVAVFFGLVLRGRRFGFTRSPIPRRSGPGKQGDRDRVDHRHRVLRAFSRAARQGDRRPGRCDPPVRDRAGRPGPRAARGRAWNWQDAAREVHRAGADAGVRPCPVHPGPHAGRHPGHLGVRPDHAHVCTPPGADLHQHPARRVHQPRAGQGPVRAARGHGGARRDARRQAVGAARSFFRPGDAKPDRVRGHLPSARGAAGPIPLQGPSRLPGRGGRDGGAASLGVGHRASRSGESRSRARARNGRHRRLQSAGGAGRPG